MAFEISYRRNVWTSVSDEVLDKQYGEEQEYGLEDLRQDLEQEGFFLDNQEIDEAFGDLLGDLPVTGEDIEDTLEKYSSI